MPHNETIEDSIERVVKTFPSNSRTCENIGLAGMRGRLGCILFQQDDRDVDSAVVADRINTLVGGSLIKSWGTCRATGARVNEGDQCGIGDDRFRMGVRIILEGK